MNCREVEEHLTPYIDGEETSVARRTMDAHLAACPPCRGEAEHERMGRDLLHASRHELRGAAPDALRARCAASMAAARASAAPPPRRNWQLGVSNVRRWVPLSLAASLVLAIGAVFLFGLNDSASALAIGLAADHQRCFKTGDSDHVVPAEAAEQGWQQDRGWALQVADTDASEQIQLVGVRRCISADGSTAHVMYRWRGKPLSVYVLSRGKGESGLVDRNGHEAAIWSDNGRTYCVLAEGHPEDFTHIVSYVKDHTR